MNYDIEPSRILNYFVEVGVGGGCISYRDMEKILTQFKIRTVYEVFSSIDLITSMTLVIKGIVK